MEIAQSSKSTTTCCIAGGGPAGMMVGLLLARAGVDVIVFEKHADFLRDFRGDTVHPSTLQVIRELGLLDQFLQRPHQQVQRITGHIAGIEVEVADFTHLKTGCPFVAFMPQWDFLDFLANEARRYPNFRLEMQTEVVDLLRDGERVIGVRVKNQAGILRDVVADLVIGADGRHSRVRTIAQLEIQDFGAPIDVLWMRLTRHANDPKQALGYFDRGRILIMLDRDDYWQCGFVIAKGGFDALKQRGIAALHQEISALAPYLALRTHELKNWDDVNLLTVRVDRLVRWSRPGLLCIGDAAHAMSPVGGVGINLAIQDAVAAANILASPLLNHSLTASDLAAVQQRRMLPTRLTQRFQIFVHRNVINRVLTGPAWTSPPLVVWLLQRWPFLRRITAFLIGVGVRPEHVNAPTSE